MSKHIIPEQEDQDILGTSAVSNTETEMAIHMEISASDNNTDVIPQWDGTAEAGLSEKELVAPGPSSLPVDFPHASLDTLVTGK